MLSKARTTPQEGRNPSPWAFTFSEIKASVQRKGKDPKHNFFLSCLED
jgi:hypothetical protein